LAIQQNALNFIYLTYGEKKVAYQRVLTVRKSTELQCLIYVDELIGN